MNTNYTPCHSSQSQQGSYKEIPRTIKEHRITLAEIQEISRVISLLSRILKISSARSNSSKKNEPK